MLAWKQLLPFIPGRLALPVLLCLVMVLLRRHRLLGKRRWLAPLSFLLIGQIGWFLAALSLPFSSSRNIGHALTLDGQLLTALFLVEGGRRNKNWHSRRLYLLKCIGPLLFITAYGLYVESRAAYIVIAVGSIVLLSPALRVPQRRPLGVGAALVMLAATALTLLHHDRVAAYGLLASAFGFATYRIWRTLPQRTLGRFAILTSLSVWTVSFAIHPLVLGHQPWYAFADNLWDLQPVFFAIGVVILLLEEQIVNTRHLAFHDQLTGLPNRRLLDDRVEEALAMARRTRTAVAIVLFDLNGFKQINDTYGHPVGDLVLVEISRRISAMLTVDETLARLGGDEFVLISARAATDGVRFRAALQQAVSVPLRINDAEVAVTASLGSAVYPDEVRGLDDHLTSALLHLADQRMYVNKTQHRAATALRHDTLSV